MPSDATDAKENNRGLGMPYLVISANPGAPAKFVYGPTDALNPEQALKQASEDVDWLGEDSVADVYPVGLTADLEIDRERMKVRDVL